MTKQQVKHDYDSKYKRAENDYGVNKQLTETWEERFEEIGFGNQAIIVGTKRVELKSFIASELQQQRREIVEMIRGIKKQPILSGGWDKDDDGKPIMGTLKLNREQFGYDIELNKALDDIIKKVEK